MRKEYYISDFDLLSNIVGEKSANLLMAKNSLHDLAAMSADELSLIVSKRESLRLVSAFALRARVSIPKTGLTIRSSKDVMSIPEILQISSDLIENFVVIGLSRRNRVIFSKIVSVGGISGTVVDQRIIAKELILKNCSAAIVCHNHPSGFPEPSEEDIKSTIRIKSAVIQIGMELLDHVIVTSDPEKYYSFADSGTL